MPEKPSSNEIIDTPGGLSSLKEKLRALKDRHEEEVAADRQQYDQLVSSAVTMAEKNNELSIAVEGNPQWRRDTTPGQYVEQAPAHKATLKEFIGQRDHEISEKRISARHRKTELNTLQEEFKQLQESGGIDEVAAQEIQGEVETEDRLVRQELEQIEILENSKKQDYDALSERYQETTDQQKKIARDQVGFAVETVYELLPPEEKERTDKDKFMADVRTQVERNQAIKNQRRELQKESDKLETNKKVVEELTTEFEHLKKKLSGDIAKIYNEKERTVAPEVIAAFNEIDKKIEKQLSGWFFTTKDANRAAEMVQDYKDLVQFYYSMLADIANASLDLRNKTEYKKDRDDETPTLKSVASYTNWIGRNLTINETSQIKEEAAPIHNEALITEERAKQLDKSIEDYRRYMQQYTLDGPNSIMRSIKEIIPLSKMNDYINKIKDKRGR